VRVEGSPFRVRGAGEPIVVSDPLLWVAVWVEEPPDLLRVDLPSLLRRSLATVTAEGAAEDVAPSPGLEDTAAVQALGATGV
jgi:hypothetical protein